MDELLTNENIKQFINEVVKDGLESIRTNSHTHFDHKDRKEGAIAGFEACMDIETVEMLREVLYAATEKQQEAFKTKSDDYWWFRYFTLQVEWVANCLSVLLMQQKKNVIVLPTQSAAMKASEVVFRLATNNQSKL